MSEKAKLGATLVTAGLINEFQLRAALGEQARWGNRLGETLVRMGYLTEPDLVRTLSRHYGIPGVHLEGKEIEPRVLAMLPAEIAEQYDCIPLFKKRIGGSEVLYLGMADPGNLRVVDDVSFRTGLPVRPVLVGPIQIRTAIAAFYRGEGPRPIPRYEASAALPETPVAPGDTAPVFVDLKEVPAESLSTAPTARDHDRDETTAPATESLAESGADAPVGAKPRDVPTRDILRALTRLLIEKEIIEPRELLERIASAAKHSGD